MSTYTNSSGDPVELPQPDPTPKAGAYLSRGDAGEEVIKLQKLLHELHYLFSEPSGSYDSLTEAAVKAFQKFNPPLVVDGIAGPKTLSALHSAKESASSPQGAIHVRLSDKYPKQQSNYLRMNLKDPQRSMNVAQQALKYKDRYVRVQQRTSVPWFVVAGIHRMESDQKWDTVLHNGEKIIGTTKKTTLVPKGRGPFATWEEAAVDALGIEWRPGAWSIGEILEFCERYNGLGYRNHGVESPYVWGLTDIYTKGRYVADGKWDPNSIHNRPGIASMIKCLEKLGEVHVG